MRLDMTHEPPPERREAIARAGLASLMSVAGANGSVSPRARSFMTSLRDHLLHVEIDLDSLKPIDAAELAREVPETEWRERILRGMTLISLLDGPPTPKRVTLLKETAAVLEIDAAPVRTFDKLARERFRMVQIDIARRSFVRPAAKAYIEDEGVRALLDIGRAILEYENEKLAARYHQLDSFPEGTFGRSYADFIALNHFNYPGEIGGPPPPVMRHDCCHVLGNYGTTPAEECAVVSFQAGFERADPFFVMLFAIAQFEVGIGASPFLPGMKGEADPERMLAGLEHGSQVNTDLIGDPAFDPWEEFPKPLEEVRQKFGIPARGREPEYPEDLARSPRP